jgi:bifunctional DNA-binding transcriptional regulator/antitoxin component of YhaV-PrlF toxin-antitoxin module
MTTVGTKYQVVIEQSVRERLGIQPGWIAVQTVVDDHVEMRFLPPEHDRSLAGSLKEYSRGPVMDYAQEKEAGWIGHVDNRGEK